MASSKEGSGPEPELRVTPWSEWVSCISPLPTVCRQKSESLVAPSYPPSATPCTAARRAPPSVGFSRQEYWRGLTLASPEDLPDQGIEPRSPTL